MLKKLFITSLLVGACVIGFAQQPDAETETKAKAKELVEQKLKDNLNMIELQLKEGKKASLPKEMKNSRQFLFQENMIKEKLDIRSTQLNDVLKQMCNKLKPSEFKYEDINVEKITDDKNKEGTVIVPISFQTRTIAKDSVSDVRYNVTFTYKVNKKEKVSFVSSSVKKIDFLNSEKKRMLDAAKNAIVEWYANLPQTLDQQYSEQSISEIQPIEITANDITAKLPDSKIFTISNVKNIEIAIDPYQFIKDSEMHLYTNPSASLIITPTFNITVDDSFDKANVSVEYSVQTIKPTNDNDKVNQLRAAQVTFEKLAKELSSYVSSKNEELKSNIQSMFNAKSTVQVSYLLKNGKEKINNRAVTKYLSLLKGSSLNFIDYTIEIPDASNLNTLVFVINQDFKSKTYSDYTQKKIYLTYNEETETYSIDKIEVVPNSTKIQ